MNLPRLSYDQWWTAPVILILQAGATVAALWYLAHDL